MKYKYSCVIDAERNYKTFVLAFLEPDETGAEEPVIQHYALGDGESLADTAPPAFRPHAGAVGFIKPRWTGEAWEEGAAPEEIAAWEVEHPAPEPPSPTEEDITLDLLAEHEERLCMLEIMSA